MVTHQLQVKESSPVKDWHSTTVPCNEPTKIQWLMQSMNGLLTLQITPNLWGHWTDLNQTWTHIHLWLLFQKFGPNSPGRPAHVAEWLTHSVAGFWLSPGSSALQRIISNNSYAHDEQGDNPGQVKGFNGVLYEVWPLLMPWLAALRYHPCWRESRSRQMWLSLLADAAEMSVRWPGAEQQTGGLSLHKCQSGPGAEWWTGQGCRRTSASPGLVRH